MKRSGRCSKCGSILTSENCMPSRFNHAGPCHSCHNDRQREIYKNNPEVRQQQSVRHSRRWKSKSAEEKRAVADRNFLYKYGVSIIDFYKKLEEQDNRCSICRVELEKSVNKESSIRACQDHDHKTKNLRDILCNRCNLMLGYSNDDIEILKKAIAYLQRHAGGSTNKTVSIEADKPAFSKVSADGEPV